METREYLGPVSLVLIAMRKLNVRVRNWICRFREFLQANDGNASRRRGP